MEKPIEEEWEMVDYHPCFEDERENEKSGLGWVIDRGFSVGKKLAITGVVISSLPLLLPPLVVISAIGFAFSVPYGVVFASYACTQKLMNKLLPSPPRSGLLDFHRTGSVHDEEDREAEILAELENEANLQAFEDNQYADGDEYDVSHGDVIMEEKEGLAGDKVDDIGGVNEEEGSEQGMEEKPSFDVLKTQDYAGENNGDDVSVHVQVQLTDEFIKNEGEQEGMSKKEKEISTQEKNEKVEKIITETKKRQTEDSKEKSSSKEIKRRGKKKKTGELESHGKSRGSEGDKRNEKENEFLKETKASSANNVEGEAGLGEMLDTLGLAASDQHKQAGEKEGTSIEIEDLDKKPKLGLLLNDDAGNIDSSLNEAEKNVGLKDSAVHDTEGQSGNGSAVEEKIKVCTVMVQDDSGVNYNESKIIANDEKTLPLKEEKDAGGVVDGGLLSDEKLYRDEKIWEKIEAIRVIVGFKAPRRASYYEELKALYLFTGIEPPSMSSDPCDFVEFYSKLCFLTSVIGLK